MHYRCDFVFLVTEHNTQAINHTQKHKEAKFFGKHDTQQRYYDTYKNYQKHQVTFDSKILGALYHEKVTSCF